MDPQWMFNGRSMDVLASLLVMTTRSPPSGTQGPTQLLVLFEDAQLFEKSEHHQEQVLLTPFPIEDLPSEFFYVTRGPAAYVNPAKSLGFGAESSQLWVPWLTREGIANLQPSSCLSCPI